MPAPLRLVVSTTKSDGVPEDSPLHLAQSLDDKIDRLLADNVRLREELRNLREAIGITPIEYARFLTTERLPTPEASQQLANFAHANSVAFRQAAEQLAATQTELSSVCATLECVHVKLDNALESEGE